VTAGVVAEGWHVDVASDELRGKVAHENRRVFLGEGLDGVEQEPELTACAGGADCVQRGGVGFATVHHAAHQTEKIESDNSLLVA
jgi:hypothetical protein